MLQKVPVGAINTKVGKFKGVVDNSKAEKIVFYEQDNLKIFPPHLAMYVVAMKA